MIVRVALVVPPVAQIGAKGLAAILTEKAKNSQVVSDVGALQTRVTHSFKNLLSVEHVFMPV